MSRQAALDEWSRPYWIFKTFQQNSDHKISLIKSETFFEEPVDLSWEKEDDICVLDQYHFQMNEEFIPESLSRPLCKGIVI